MLVFMMMRPPALPFPNLSCISFRNSKRERRGLLLPQRFLCLLRWRPSIGPSGFLSTLLQVWLWPLASWWAQSKGVTPGDQREGGEMRHLPTLIPSLRGGCRLLSVSYSAQPSALPVLVSAPSLPFTPVSSLGAGHKLLRALPTPLPCCQTLIKFSHSSCTYLHLADTPSLPVRHVCADQTWIKPFTICECLYSFSRCLSSTYYVCEMPLMSQLF